MSHPTSPKNTLPLRTSERTTFKRCRWLWDVSYNQLLVPKVKAPPLRFGTLVHKALELRYPPGVKRGPHPATTFRKLYEEELKQAETVFGFRDDDGEWADAGTMGEAMLNGWVEEYGKDSQWKVLASEQVFHVPVYDEVGAYRVTAVGTIDCVMQNRSNRRIFFHDYKTAKSISTTHLPLDEQAGQYWAFGPDWLRYNGWLPPKADISGIIYTFLRKALPDTRPRNQEGHYLNQDGTVSKRQPEPLFHRTAPVYRDAADQANVRQRVLEEAADMRRVRAGKSGAYKNPGPFTCMGCPVKDACELHETGADYQLMLDSTMVAGDPYETYNQHGDRVA